MRAKIWRWLEDNWALLGIIACGMMLYGVLGLLLNALRDGP